MSPGGPEDESWHAQKVRTKRPAHGKLAISAAIVLTRDCWAVETTLGPHIPLGRESSQPRCTSEETEAQELRVS